MGVVRGVIAAGIEERRAVGLAPLSPGYRGKGRRPEGCLSPGQRPGLGEGPPGVLSLAWYYKEVSMTITSVTSKGQVTIHTKPVRQQLGIRQGSRIEFSLVGDHVDRLRVRSSPAEMPASGFGMLTSRKRAVPSDFRLRQPADPMIWTRHPLCSPAITLRTRRTPRRPEQHEAARRLIESGQPLRYARRWRWSWSGSCVATMDSLRKKSRRFFTTCWACRMSRWKTARRFRRRACQLRGRTGYGRCTSPCQCVIAIARAWPRLMTQKFARRVKRLGLYLPRGSGSDLGGAFRKSRKRTTALPSATGEGESYRWPDGPPSPLGALPSWRPG